ERNMWAGRLRSPGRSAMPRHMSVAWHQDAAVEPCLAQGHVARGGRSVSRGVSFNGRIETHVAGPAQLRAQQVERGMRVSLKTKLTLLISILVLLVVLATSAIYLSTLTK